MARRLDYGKDASRSRASHDVREALEEGAFEDVYVVVDTGLPSKSKGRTKRSSKKSTTKSQSTTRLTSSKISSNSFISKNSTIAKPKPVSQSQTKKKKAEKLQKKSSAEESAAELKKVLSKAKSAKHSSTSEPGTSPWTDATLALDVPPELDDSIWKDLFLRSCSIAVPNNPQLTVMRRNKYIYVVLSKTDCNSTILLKSIINGRTIIYAICFATDFEKHKLNRLSVQTVPKKKGKSKTSKKSKRRFSKPQSKSKKPKRKGRSKDKSVQSPLSANIPRRWYRKRVIGYFS